MWCDGMRSTRCPPLRLCLLGTERASSRRGGADWGAAASAEAEALREQNAALAIELERVRGDLAALGLEHSSALAAAQAGEAAAEAEVARAREAAACMMTLADQIQGLFALCEVRN